MRRVVKREYVEPGGELPCDPEDILDTETEREKSLSTSRKSLVVWYVEKEVA